MNRAIVDQVMSAVLYEGYILYPYRPSLKNRQRWTFGGLYPRAYSEAQGGADAWSIQTQCLVEGQSDTRLEVAVRFLHLMARRIGRLVQPLADLPEQQEPPLQFVESLQVGDTLHHTWQEAVEREIALDALTLQELAAGPRRWEFHFPSQRTHEALRSPGGDVVGLILREQEPIEGAIDLSADQIETGLWRITVRVVNESSLEKTVPHADHLARDEALMRSLVSTHAILGVEQGKFVSLTDPPPQWREPAAGCRNVGVWPVLVGEEGQRDTMLASPIILYDYPQIAPESPGAFFDSTEIDELLTLRILTLTDEEKLAMMAVDPQASALLERTEARARQELMGLHGAVRGLRAAGEEQ